MKNAPIALFAYNRPNHLRRTVEALLLNEPASQSDLFVFSDGPKSSADRLAVDSVRAYARTITGFRKVTLIEREQNLGLAKSIITGVSEILHEYDSIIVLEDDLLTSPYFLQYLNDGLRRYENVTDVVSIHSYVYPVKGKLPETFFIRGADCLGWATWRRGWQLFETDGSKLLQELEQKNLTRAFDFSNSFSYTQMLRDQIAGRNSSWAVRWYASAFLKNRLTLYPARSLVYHFGNDGSGTHSAITSAFDNPLTKSPVLVENIPIKESKEALRLFIRFFRKLKPSLARRVFRKLRSYVTPVYGFLGTYQSWEAAKRHSVGYADSVILDKVSESARRVQEGRAVFERDGVLFYKSEYNEPLLSSLLRIAADYGGRLDLIDFGGSLGSTYFQHREAFAGLTYINWCIIEQSSYVERGRKIIHDPKVSFSDSLTQSVKKHKPDIILLSSSLQYIEKPYELLAQIFSFGIEYIVIDRTPFLATDNDRIAVQKVSPHIYRASYPAWLFSKQSFLNFFSGKYELVQEVENSPADLSGIMLCGFILKKKHA